MTDVRLGPAVMVEVLIREDSYAGPPRGDGVRRSNFRFYQLTLGCADCGFRKHPDALKRDHVHQEPRL